MGKIVSAIIITLAALVLLFSLVITYMAGKDQVLPGDSKDNQTLPIDQDSTAPKVPAKNGSQKPYDKTQVSCPVGVYSFHEADKAIPDKVFDNPNIEGVSIRSHWKKFEPTKGNFNWSYIDGVISKAKANGKKVAIRLVHARKPSYAKVGVENFVWQENGEQRKINLPWDEKAKEYWMGVVKELSRKYKNEEAVSLVHVTGWCTPKSNEMHLPGVEGKKKLVDQWVDAGYTRQKHENAWQDCLDVFRQYFPNKKLGFTISVSLPVPGESDVWGLPDSLISYATKNFGNQFLFQNNGLTAKTRQEDWQGIYNILKKTSVSDDIAFQMAWWVTGAKSRMAGDEYASSPEPLVLREAINRGLRAGASYMEIYEQDILNPAMQPILENTARELKENSGCI